MTKKQTPITDTDDLSRTLRESVAHADSLLGEILLTGGEITPEQLQETLDAQKASKPKKHLGELLVEFEFVSQEQVNIALADKLGVPYVSLEDFAVEQFPVSLIPPDIALQYNILPLAIIQGSLVIAMENPFDWEALEVVRFNVKKSIEPVLSPARDITQALNKFYSDFSEDNLLAEIESSANFPITPIGVDASPHVVAQEANKAPIVRLLDAIISQGILRKASDINIRPEKLRVNVFYRIDGKMQFVRTFHKSLLQPLISRIKIMGHMDIAERRMPQDGHARVFRNNRPVDLRLSIIPTVVGESAVLRILDKEVGLKPIDSIGLMPKELESLKGMITKTTGMLLVVGPTGSGKSTTLYSILNEIRKNNPHVITVEDPVEYHIEGLEQIQTASSRGYTFAEALRHILRHDPDVIMVGEIRDSETVQIANKAALTGHLVLSTLHTNDAPSTITRLTDMGVEPYLLSSTLLGVLSQRLVRLNCSHCVEEASDDDEIRKALGIKKSGVFFRGKGCAACDFSGYHGRHAVCELLVITPEIRQLINEGATAQSIKETAIKQGMVPIFESALELAREARISLEEVYSVRLE
ncbi:MAG: Flp pilus assembly complex ATPase component TadA [Gammaproteobacteria bacterium]|nr:Flp pilus assembly complex ATPase component TadA [Gammaproteobacteria bacterium]